MDGRHRISKISSLEMRANKKQDLEAEKNSNLPLLRGNACKIAFSINQLNIIKAFL
jgi:hypothetical protein